MTDSRCSITDLTLEQALIRIKEIEDENRAHRDNLREHNAKMREQCENLELWRRREQEQFEQTKALITALREENQDMQVQIMALKDKEKETTAQVSALTKEKSHLLRQNAFSQQRMHNLLTQAEEQGVKDLEANVKDDAGPVSCTDLEPIVFVSTKEAEIAKLEAAVASKDETIAQLRASHIKREQDVEQQRETVQQLLKDMQNQQRLKATVEEENRNLTQRLLNMEKQMHQHMQSVMASKKSEIQVPLQNIKEHRLPTLVTEGNIAEAAGASAVVLSYPDNPQDVMDTIQSLDAEKQREQAKRELERKVKETQHAKEDLQKEVNTLTSQVEHLQAKLDQQRREATEIQLRANKAMETLTQQYEQKLEEVVQQSREHEEQSMRAATTGDISMLRSQVLTLIREVDEANTKNSAQAATLHLKDNRIEELEGNTRLLMSERAALMQEKSRLIQTLHSQNVQQERAQQENANIRQQYQQLQDSFSSLVTDYKELEEMLETKFQAYKQQMEDKKSKTQSRHMMEEINRLTAQVIAAEEAMARKDEELRKLKSVDEELQVAKMQAEYYKSDFTAERESRTKLADELNAVREENRQLKEERDVYNQQQIYNMQTRHSAAPNTPLMNWHYPPPTHTMMPAHSNGAGFLPGAGQAVASQYSPQPNGTLPTPLVYPAPAGGAGEEDLRSFQQYECPFCRKQCPDEDSVQLHVNECLEKN